MNTKIDALDALKACAIATIQAKDMEREYGEHSPDARIAREIARDADETLAHAFRTYIVSRPFPWADGVAYHGIAFFPRDCDAGTPGVRAYVEKFDAETPPPPECGRVLDILQDDGALDPGWMALEAEEKAVDEADRRGEGWKTGRPDEWCGD